VGGRSQLGIERRWRKRASGLLRGDRRAAQLDVGGERGSAWSYSHPTTGRCGWGLPVTYSASRGSCLAASPRGPL
jgi:hypothetical protein